MTKQEVLDLMKTSKTIEDWNMNCDKVKEAYNRYPDFWYNEVIRSGLMDQILGQGSSDITIRVLK